MTDAPFSPSSLSPEARPAAEWQALDAAHHLHPFSDMASLNRQGSRVIVRGEGVYLWDADGEKILDGMAGLWCVNLGYGRQDLVTAAARQMTELPYYNTFFKTTHPPVARLSALLADVAPPGFEHFFFCNSGSEGNDTTLRIVHRYWQAMGQPAKKWFIARRNAYHGSTVAAASLGGMAYMHEQMPSQVAHIAHIDQPYWYGQHAEADPEVFGLACAAQLERKIVELGADQVAAFIAEPFQGAGGVIFPPASYWPEIERICRRYDVLLCADEVIGGFGRTGHWFAHQYFGFTPDTMTLAKGLTSGYVPMGAVALQRKVADVLLTAGDFNHGMTYSGHPVAAAVAIASLTALQNEAVVMRVQQDTGPYFQRCLREALADSPLVGDIAGVGLVAGIQLCADRASRRRWPDGDAVGLLCRDFCFSNNLIMRATGDRMLLSPPLVITRQQIEELVTKAAYCIGLTAKALDMV